VLNRIGALATSLLRGSDAAGRLGGDEFCVLLLEADRHAGERFLNRFRSGLSELQSRSELPPCVGVSAGCAHFPTEAPDPRALLRLADTRQYTAKRAKSD
jgi:diguanylate cyclase (GGDEF)-like protein